MFKRITNLQLMSDGGAGAGASAGDAGASQSGAVTGVEGAPPVAQDGGDLSNVVYGRSLNQEVANPNDVNTTNDVNPADKQKAFDELIKKGGEFADEFGKRTQDIINKRFKEVKGLEETLKSHESILGLLAAKYGVDPTNSAAIEKAIKEDDSLFEQAAFQEGLTPEQYRHKLELEQENARLKAAQDELELQRGSQEIYAGWLQEADELVAKYGLTDFDFATEVENPQITQLLASGVPFEAAYKTVHFDDMLGGAMAYTAQNVSQAMVNNIQARNRRPAENGTMSASNTIFKTDPRKFTPMDLDEIKRRVAAGEEIAL